MSILYLTQNRKRMQKTLGTLIVVFMTFTLLMATCFPGTARAVGAKDIITEVSNKNLQSPTFSSDTEPVPGGSFKFYEALGDLGRGWASLSICEPVGATGIQAVVNWETTNQQKYGIEVKTLNTSAGQGYQVREYTDLDTVGIWYVYPKYFIQVEIIETGNSTEIDMQTAQGLAGQLIAGLQKNGLLNPPVAESTSNPAGGAASSAAVVSTAKALAEPVKVADTFNIAGVHNQPTAPTTFTITKPHLVTYITNYHWNNAKGSSPGLIGLKDQNGKIYGPWQASGRPGQGGVPNAYWEVSPNIVIPAGTYTLTDSDPATWSQNSQSGGKGMSEVKATPHFEATNDSGKSSGTGAVRTSECPAGVGSVGNIPGPANTTEAVVGVVVPGLIATALGALAGLGGGGGFTPPGGTPLSPTGGGPAGTGSSPTGGTTGGPGNAQNNRIQEVGQIGRKRPEDIMISVENELFIDAEQEDNLRVQPAPGLITETREEAAVLIQPETGIIIDAAGEGAGVLSQPGKVGVPTAGRSDGGILIDTSALDMQEPAASVVNDENVNTGKIELTEEGYDENGLDSQGFDRNGYDQVGYDKDGYNVEGFDKNGFDRNGYDENGFDKSGYDKEGYNEEGFNRENFDREGFDKNGYNSQGYDRESFNKSGYDSQGYNKEGFNKEGYNIEGYNAKGYDRQGFDRSGYDSSGYDRAGYNQEGYNREGYNAEGYNQDGYNRSCYDQAGFDKQGFNKEGYYKEGYDREGYRQDGYNEAGYDRQGYNKDGYNQEGYDRNGYDKDGFNKDGFDKEGYDRKGYDRKGIDKEGYDQNGYDLKGFNKEGFDQDGFDKNGFDAEGYGRNGFDKYGYDREGYDVNGYDEHGYNHNGYDAKGYNKSGYNKEGFDKDGWDKDGYGRNGLNKEGYDREGYDAKGFDKDGYNRDGYDREGMQREGYDEEGYDKKGFNENGYDRDGFDREGFNYEGYNRGGYDPWGYNHQGYGKDGYHWSGYNADGYNRDGRHWSENPFEGDGNPFNVATQDPFGEGEVIPFGAKWTPTKPKLGEPYPGTVEKYGAKPWTNDTKPEPETPSVPKTGDSETIGPEDPQNTLENHDPGIGKAPETPDESSIPQNIPEDDWPENGGDTLPEQEMETGNEQEVPAVQGLAEADPNTFTVTDPETGEKTTYEYPEGYDGPRQGDTQILVGKTDGRPYELEFDAVKGKWINTESGNEFNPDDFDRWQNDLAEDKRRIAQDIEKMSQRQDANSKAIDKNLSDWQNLEQMQKAADKYNIGIPGGPGDMDKAIQDLKDDMLAGKEVDQDRMEQLKKIIGNRITGKTTGDSGERWEEDWFKNLGWALEANAATAKEVVTGEKADGSISWLGMAARIMITAASGGATLAGTIGSQVVMDGALTVAEAMYRIKDSIDKGESDFRAVSKALGQLVLGEEIGWLAGKAGGSLMKKMLERFPVFTNTAADLIEKGALIVMGGDQIASHALGLVGRESAEEAIDQINKRLVDLGSDTAAKNMGKVSKFVGLGAAGSVDDISKGLGKAASGSGDDIAKGVGKAFPGGDDLDTGVGKAGSSSGDDLIKGTGKTAASSDDIGKGTGKSNFSGEDDLAKGGKAASGSDDIVGGSGGEGAKAADGLDTPQKSAAAGGDIPGGPNGPARTGAGGGEGPGDPGTPSSGGDAGNTPEDIISNRPLNTNARTPEEVLADPAAVARAENTVQNNVKDFDNLPPARQEELIREQAIYDEYKMQAQEKNYNLADKVQRGERISVDDVMEMKADPASMRTLKNLEHTEGIGAELGTTRSQQVQSEFNEVLETQIHQPSYRDVESHLSGRYNGAEVRCRTVRTPGTEDTTWNINTDNDVIAERLVNGPNGPEWVEIPKSEWEDVYRKSFAKHSGFNKETAACRFPDKNWAEMDDAACYKEWADLHEEAPMDQFDPMAARDFSNQRTAILNGDRPDGPLLDRNGNLLRDPVDSEQLGMMEKHKINDYWNKGDTPAEIMKNQTESLEQLRKTAHTARSLEGGTQNMPPNMQEAIRVVNNNNMSPALRSARLQELGYDTPGDLAEKLTSRIGAFR